jgi:hypothetical protein
MSLSNLSTPQLIEYLKQTTPHQEFLKQQYWKYQFKLVLQELLTPKRDKETKTETYYEKNKEAIKAKQRVYRMLNADKIKERNQDYYYRKHYPQLFQK